MGLIREEIEFHLFWMGFDTSNVLLMIPLQAVWTAVEEVDRQLFSADSKEELNESLEQKGVAR